MLRQQARPPPDAAAPRFERSVPATRGARRPPRTVGGRDAGCMRLLLQAIGSSRCCPLATYTPRPLHRTTGPRRDSASRIGSESHCGPEEPAKRPLNPRDAPVRFRKDKVFESCTLQPFATVLEPVPNANGKQGMLCGTAVRCMLGMCWLEMTRAYAFGLYVDSSALRTLARRKYEWTPSGEGATAKPRPTRFLIDSKARQPRSWGELSLSLRMAIDIDGPHLAHGFKRSGECVEGGARWGKGVRGTGGSVRARHSAPPARRAPIPPLSGKPR